MHEALNNLTQDDSIMILPADKGRASVVLDTNTYHEKMKTLIKAGPYQLPNKDPTDRPGRKLTEKLLNLKRSGNLSETIYNKIRPKHKQPPRIYGQPKIHKPNVPLRPIVSCINTFAYDLSAHLADILSPLTGKSEYAVTNSAHFVNTINHERIQEKEIMVSFDVESLFTQTRKRSRSSRPHKPNTYTNCRPFKLCFTIHVFPVQWINLQTKGRSRYGEPCLRGYSQHLHGACDSKCDSQTRK